MKGKVSFNSCQRLETVRFISLLFFLISFHRRLIARGDVMCSGFETFAFCLVRTSKQLPFTVFFFLNVVRNSKEVWQHKSATAPANPAVAERLSGRRFN